MDFECEFIVDDDPGADAMPGMTGWETVVFEVADEAGEEETIAAGIEELMVARYF
jgi:hypothetical protein